MKLKLVWNWIANKFKFSGHDEVHDAVKHNRTESNQGEVKYLPETGQHIWVHRKKR